MPVKDKWEISTSEEDEVNRVDLQFLNYFLCSVHSCSFIHLKGDCVKICSSGGDEWKEKEEKQGGATKCLQQIPWRWVRR